MTDTARERATDMLDEALNAARISLERQLPRSVSASIVNELLTAVDDERNATLAELAEARLNHDAQIGKLIEAVRHQGIGEFAEAEAIITELQVKRG